MAPVISIIVGGLAALFLSIPIWNKEVFHTVNIDAIIQQGRDGFAAIKDNMDRGNYPAARVSAQALIEQMRNDSLTIFIADVSQWDSVLALFKENRNDLRTSLLVSRFSDALLDTVRQAEKGAQLSQEAKQKVVATLNEMKDDLGFYINNRADLSLEKQPKVRKRLEDLLAKGVFIDRGDKLALKSDLTPQEVRLIKRFHLTILEKVLYPQFIYKDLKRNTDWASEYAAQTAMFYIGNSYEVQFQNKEAIRVYDSIITLYPKSIYAEALFLEIGKMLCSDAKTELVNNQRDAANADLHEAVRYLEKVEKNREIARDFPKYKLVDLAPDTFQNVDVISRAKRNIREKAKVYSLAEEKAELSGQANAEKSGTTLEDAVRIIGECYMLLGQTDSARSQFSLIPEFFPESDNIDDAQKLIADSYVKDADIILGGADSADADARRRAYVSLEKAIKEYQKFVNVYPQSDLVPDIYIAMGDVYLKMKRPADAQRAFASALNLAKETESKAQIQLRIGKYYYERKQYAEAIKAFNVILTNYLSTQVAPNAQVLLGDCYQQTGDTANAIKAYKTIVEIYKYAKEFFTGAAEKVAQYYFDQKNYKEAYEYYKMGYAQDPAGNRAAYLLLQIGKVWMEMARQQKGEEQAQTYQEAIKQFSKVVEQFKGTPYSQISDDACYQLAQCYMAVGNESAAKAAVKNIDSKDIVVSAIKIIGVESDNELAYWEQSYKDATEDEERAAILLQKASIFLTNDKAKNYDSALAAYQEVTKFSKDAKKILNARIGVARTYMFMKKFDMTISTLNEILAEKAIQIEVRLQLEIQLYDAYFKAKDYQKAFDGFEQFAIQHPEHTLTPYAIYSTGSIYSEQKDFQKALERMQTVVSKYKDSDVFEKAVLGVGEQTINLGKAEEGVKYLEKFLKDHQDAAISIAPNFYMKIGEAYNTVLNNKEKARLAYETIVNKFPNEPMYSSYAAYQLGLILKSNGDDKAAIAALNKVKKEDASVYRAAQAEIGKIMAKTNPEAAIENYWKIVSESTAPEDSALAIIGIGDVYRSVQKWDQAAQTYGKVYGFYSNGKDTALLCGAIVNWVDALVNAKHFDEAIKAAQTMQTRFPANQYTINTVYFEAASWSQKKNYERARKKFQEIIAANKSEQLTEIAVYQQGDCYFFEKSYKTAINEYNAYLKKYPQGKYAANAYFMQANCYWYLDDFKNAAERFGIVVAKFPEFPDICNAKNLLAYSMNKNGRWKDALSYYAQVLKNSSCPANTHDFANKESEKIKTEH